MIFSDESDRATHLEEIEREARIRAVRAASESAKLKPMGNCYFCEEPIKAHLVFCDAECRDLWERERQARIRNGDLAGA